MHPQLKVRNGARRQEQLAVPGGLNCWFVRAILTCKIFGLIVIPFLSVLGQAEALIQVLAPEVKDFPVVSLQFKLKGTVFPLETGLQIEQLNVLEDEKTVQILSLTKEYAGVYFTLAINGAHDMDLRDTFGISIYDKLSDALIGWASSKQYHFGDTWSLENNEGTGVRNLDSPDAWVKALSDYQPNFRKMEPGLTSLETGVQLASDRIVDFGVDKTLLYITPPPAAEDLFLVKELAEQARSAGIQVNIWMVGDALFLDNDQGKALINLANNTGGQFYHFTGVQTLPAPETYLEYLGYTHTLTYESGIRETGSYPVTLEVSLPEGIIRGESIPFYIGVSPPNPMLVSPPAVITRQAVMDETGQNNWTPKIFEIDIIVDFPDDHRRDIAVSRLYVDGDMMVQQTEPPFDVLPWDLAGLTESGEHTLQVEVEDVWGLSKRTIITPVQVEVISPEPSSKFQIQQFSLTVVILILASAVIILMTWLARRNRKAPHLMGSKGRMTDLPGYQPGKALIRPTRGNKIFATLVPLASSTEDPDQSSLSITNARVSLGNDPSQADMVLLLSDIAGLHADLYFEHGEFWLRDLDSPAGTWVNYNRVGTEPVQIHAGDLIHFGDAGFRFTMVGTGTLAEVSVSRYEPIL